jgi:RHS repeat-associated protein
MTQRDRDRLVVLKQTLKRQITQEQAADQLECSERHVRRLVKRLKSEGDRAVIHGLRGRASNRKRSEKERDKIVRILSQKVYHGFGPTLAAEYLASQHQIKIGREALRKLMMAAGLWRGGQRQVEAVHVWRERRSSRGELVQWDTSGTVTYVYDAEGQLAVSYSTMAQMDTGTSYLTADALGSTRLITSSTGVAKECYDYLPFGQEVPGAERANNACFSNPGLDNLKFTGKERDAETGVDFFKARYMSSAQGRFTSPDPIGNFVADPANPQSWNLYSYVWNNPLALIDPSCVRRQKMGIGTTTATTAHFCSKEHVRVGPLASRLRATTAPVRRIRRQTFPFSWKPMAATGARHLTQLDSVAITFSKRLALTWATPCPRASTPQWDKRGNTPCSIRSSIPSMPRTEQVSWWEA